MNIMLEMMSGAAKVACRPGLRGNAYGIDPGFSMC
jgi:hypothetical protein